jgi:hypothetical protein
LRQAGNADPSAWTVEKSANVIGKQGLLIADSCGSATSCMAVGYGFNKAGIEDTEAQRWNGSKWSVQKLPETPGDLASEFIGVSCTSATACTAVGSYLESPEVQVSLAEVWNGTSWSIETTPNPPGAQVSALEGVSCTSSTKCIAVGGSEDSSGDTTTLVEKRKGTSWSIETTPNPSGSEDTLLKSVVCTSTSSCTAVGGYVDSSGNEYTVAELSNGSSWSIQTSPNASGSTQNVLAGVSCASASACSAVGVYLNSSDDEEALAEEWNGTSWSLEAVPNPSGAQESVLVGVSCTTAGGCTAVGGFLPSSGPEMTLAEVWNGSSWSIQTTPSPSGDVLLSALTSVACNSAGGCTAAGYDFDNSIGVTLVEVRNGTSWSIKTSADSKGTVAESALVSVSCTSASACMAVGAGAISVDYALAEAWNGTSWSIKATPSPSGAQASFLAGVSCTSATACTAVGGYSDSSGDLVTLAEAWNGTSWSIEATPNPSGAPTSVLDGVSCTSASACTAVGYYNDASGVEDTLAEVWDGTTWSIQATPDSPGAVTSNLAGVSCTSDSACTAVGTYVDSSDAGGTLAEAWDGTSWSIQTTPDPSGAGSSGLSEVSCNSSGDCTAAGGYLDDDSVAQPFAEEWNGTSWSPETTPLPSGAEGGALSGLSCTSTGPCTAVGNYTDSSGVDHDLAEVWNGTSWTFQTTADPSNGQQPTLSDVACTTSDGCTAVGEYTTISGVEVTLVEVGPSP